MPSVFERRVKGFVDASAAPEFVVATPAESFVRPLAHRKLECGSPCRYCGLVFVHMVHVHGIIAVRSSWH